MLDLLLPVLPVLTFCLLYKSFRAQAFGHRVIRSAVLWGFILLALVEALSAFRAVTRYNLALGWSLALVGSGLYTMSRGIRLRPEGWPRLPQPARLYWALLVIVILPTLAISILTLPNNWDALTYHIARVDQWVQNRSVEFYPVLDQRANESAPLAEYIILNFRLLSGSYALANLTQWFAMIGSLISIFSIAKMLGGGERGATLAVAFGATIPMGVLQASSTQTDYCASFWLLAFIAQFLRWRGTRLWSDLLFGSAALALAILTKGTTAPFALPFGLWLLADLVTGSRAPLRHRATALVICGLCVLLPNLPHAIRNMEAYGNPLGGPIADMVTNHTFAPATVAATVIRNIALQFATPSEAINQGIVDEFADLATPVGIDLKDTASSFSGLPFTLSTSITHENIAGNPLHTVMVVGLLIALPWMRPANCYADRIYAGCGVVGFLLFAALLKWQPWGSRLLLPGFLILAPLFGVVAARFTSPIIRVAVPALLLLGALPSAYLNISKPLIRWLANYPPIWQMSRHATMFVNLPPLEEQYTAVAGYLKQCGCNQVGLATTGTTLGTPGLSNSWIAPVFTAMAEQGFASFRIEHVQFATPLERLPYPLGPFSPNAILWLGGENPEVISFGGVTFVPALETKDLHVYRPDPQRAG